MDEFIPIAGTPYHYKREQTAYLKELSEKVAALRSGGKLSGEGLAKIRKFFKIKNIYNSNAIEGNTLDIGETREVIERGMTITGKSLQDQAEAKNLSEALDFLEVLAQKANGITENEIRQIHAFILKGIDNENRGTYRRTDVKISGSEYSPPRSYDVPIQMQDFGAWLGKVTAKQLIGDTNAIIIAAAAHTWFVTIHPFVDGNGRTARLVMNLVLMRFGYPIAIITKDDRLRYYDSLEESQSSDLSPFVSLVIESLHESLEEYEYAFEIQRQADEWAKSIAARFDKTAEGKAKNRYEIWKNAMELIKGTFRQYIEAIGENANFAKLYFTDYGILAFEKYASLITGHSAKKTWFFRVDFRNDKKAVRYLFFFGSPSYHFREHKVDAAIVLAREEPEGTFNYERLENITRNDVPAISEVGYSLEEEAFKMRKGTLIVTSKIEGIAKEFIEEVVKEHFHG